MDYIFPMDVQQRKRHLNEVAHDEILWHVFAMAAAEQGVQVAPIAVLHDYVQLGAALCPLCTEGHS